MKNKGFTLAEVLITLAIIGVVAAMAIPSVISNAQQQEFKTGLRKAVSVLNSAITMNIALDGESPYDNHDLFRYLQRHMSVMKSTSSTPWRFYVYGPDGVTTHYTGLVSSGNSMFYTTDGMRFEFLSATSNCTKDTNDYFTHVHNHSLQENPLIKPHLCTSLKSGEINPNFKCGSYGLSSNPNKTTATPCMIMVDVNGDRKPYPSNVNCKATSCAEENKVRIINPNQKKINDTFSIIITEDRAIPFGVAAQKAMYQAQK